MAIVCDAALCLRPLAQVLRDRDRHVSLLPAESEPALAVLAREPPDVVLFTSDEGRALADAIRSRRGARPRPVLLRITPPGSDPPACAAFDSVLEGPLSPRLLSRLIDAPASDGRPAA